MRSRDIDSKIDQLQQQVQCPSRTKAAVRGAQRLLAGQDLDWRQEEELYEIIDFGRAVLEGDTRVLEEQFCIYNEFGG